MKQTKDNARSDLWSGFPDATGRPPRTDDRTALTASIKPSGAVAITCSPLPAEGYPDGDAS